MIPKRGKYMHYKGKMYEVLGIAYHSDDLSQMVLYKPLYESELGTDALFVRPLKEFSSDVIVNGRKVPRFRFIG